MSAPRTNMHRLQELVRLHREGTSARRAGRLLRMGRNTVQRYQQVLAEAGLLDGPVDDLPSQEALRAAVESALPPTPPRQQRSTVEDWEPKIIELAEKGVNPKSIYDYLRLEYADFEGSYHAVKRVVARWKHSRAPQPEDVALPVETAPGQVAQVDFFEVQKLYDPKEGRLRRCWLFVMQLAYSRHLFAELVFDQRSETWQRLHAQAFAFFGGVPEVVVPDNLKAAVIRAAFDTSGEASLNLSYVELARHYGFLVDPTPARSPKKKGKVERVGRYVRESFMRPRDFEDIHEARVGLSRWIREIAGTRIHGTTGKRPWELFLLAERAALRSLPAMPYKPRIWHQAKVHRDSHVQFRQHLYSVPWNLLGQTVWICATAEDVEVRADDRRVALHRRADGHGRTTHAAHLPDGREQWRHQDRAYWERKAEGMGDEVYDYVMSLFEAEDVLLQLRKVQAIVTFLRRYPPERREAACKRALFYGVTSVRAFKDILRKDLDVEPLPGELFVAHGALDVPRFARGAAAFIQPTPEA
ncbi:MAG: IS21 family transposase [Alphaproteobacteria bacterium]|nr:IS21 family transposase [Alphaproteobacteria bacterium]